MQRILHAVGQAVDSEAGRKELSGHSAEQVKLVVQKITTALDTLPPEVTMHALLAGIVFVRNAVQMTMAENDRILIHNTGGHA